MAKSSQLQRQRWYSDYLRLVPTSQMRGQSAMATFLSLAICLLSFYSHYQRTWGQKMRMRIPYQQRKKGVSAHTPSSTEGYFTDTPFDAWGEHW